MTCLEFASFTMSGLGPEKCTHAEGAAVYAHWRACPECRDLLQRKTDEQVRKIGPARAIIATVAGACYADVVRADPEAKAVIDEANKKCATVAHRQSPQQGDVS